ncbi:MAG: type II secretion system protein GspM [Pseudomonadota bacterium]
MTGLIDLLAARSTRERVLLAVMLLVALPAAVYVTVLEPVASARQEALIARDEALALNGWVAERAAEVPAQSPVTPPRAAPVGATGIEAALRTAGLRPAVTTLTEDNDGQISIRFDSVTFTQLATWLSGQSERWGYALSAFRIEATDAPGKVSASLTLQPEA